MGRQLRHLTVGFETRQGPRISIPYFFANRPAFSAETRFAISSQHVGTESAKFAFDTFAALGCGRWHPLV